MEERVFTIADHAHSSDEKALKTVFHRTSNSSASVWVVRPGQQVGLHRHHHAGDAWVCLQGEGMYHPEPGMDVPLRAGQVAIAPRGACHGLTNTGDEDFVFVSICPETTDVEPIDWPAGPREP